MDQLLSSNIDNSFPEVSSYEDYEDAKVSTISFDIIGYKNGENPLISSIIMSHVCMLDNSLQRTFTLML